MNDELITATRAKLDEEGIKLPKWVWQGFEALYAERAALTAQLAEARESERAAMTEVNGLKDALAQAGGTFERDDHD